ncbi:hypothetical protein LCGC14_0393010 [marine sediment metagenome]|uniref:Uncharacterized protein n=1 Tax=marine sediment metagenome TaxID=412755 RepID=A0A0F9SZ35_9ZZZZ
MPNCEGINPGCKECMELNTKVRQTVKAGGEPYKTAFKALANHIGLKLHRISDNYLN